MKFTKYSSGANAFYESAEINGLKATIHGTNAIHTFDIKLGARYKITIKNVVSNVRELKIYHDLRHQNKRKNEKITPTTHPATHENRTQPRQKSHKILELPAPNLTKLEFQN